MTLLNTKYTLLATGALIITAGTKAPHILKNSFNQTNFWGNNLKLDGQESNEVLTNTRMVDSKQIYLIH